MTREERLDWLCRLRSGLVWFDVPPKERPMFENALSEEIKALSAEPCEDAINRQMVLDTLDTTDKFMDEDRTVETYKALLKECYVVLPSVAPKQKMGRWIPVSERLPVPFSFVNCTCHSLIDDREDWVVETAYLPQPPNSTYSDWGNIPMLNWRECEVIAWMYRDIPKPYKAESEETE